MAQLSLAHPQNHYLSVARHPAGALLLQYAWLHGEEDAWRLIQQLTTQSCLMYMLTVFRDSDKRCLYAVC